MFSNRLVSNFFGYVWLLSLLVWVYSGVLLASQSIKEFTTRKFQNYLDIKINIAKMPVGFCTPLCTGRGKLYQSQSPQWMFQFGSRASGRWWTGLGRCSCSVIGSVQHVKILTMEAFSSWGAKSWIDGMRLWRISGLSGAGIAKSMLKIYRLFQSKQFHFSYTGTKGVDKEKNQFWW